MDNQKLRVEVSFRSLSYQVLKCVLQIAQMKLDVLNKIKKVNIRWYYLRGISCEES